MVLFCLNPVTKNCNDKGLVDDCVSLGRTQVINKRIMLPAASRPSVVELYASTEKQEEEKGTNDHVTIHSAFGDVLRPYQALQVIYSLVYCDTMTPLSPPML